MEEIKMPGVIKWYDKEKGYGYILGYDDESYYFSVNSLEKPYDNFTKGEEVLFIPEFTDMCYARKVEKVNHV